MKKLPMTVAVSLLTVTAPGLAAAESGNYVAVRAGINDTRESDFNTDESATRSTTVSSKYDTGYGAALAIGRVLDASRNLGLRTEFELGYSETEADSHREVVTDSSGPSPQTVSRQSLSPAKGDLMVTTAFANFYGETELDAIANAHFLVGVGGGLAQVNLDQAGAPGNIKLDDQATTYGFHLSTGWSYDLNDQISLEAMYRYQSIEDVDLESVAGNEDSARLDSHNFLAGLRYNF
ncbi:outer membrane beta-barrel protein [Salicola sp. Rm-C-2C1-2]|uniref:outer membrane protein n=1 Tax=Salicola sp. Rm-C-2C1-2 TaxID=3141321 RepID=UPI0032E4D008